MIPLPEQTNKVNHLLSCMDADREVLLDYYKSGHAQTGGNLYAMDMFVLGAVKRTLSLTAAMKVMIQTWNLLAARTLLRTHIDTALRFSAAWLVDDPEDFAVKVMEGQRIDLMKHGKERMKDSYLIKTLASDYPWLEVVYQNLSGYIHYSSAHVTSSLFNIREEGKFSFRLSESDLTFPEQSWIEVLECFRETTGILFFRISGYVESKNTVDAELKAGRESSSGKIIK